MTQADSVWAFGVKPAKAAIRALIGALEKRATKDVDAVVTLAAASTTALRGSGREDASVILINGSAVSITSFGTSALAVDLVWVKFTTAGHTLVHGSVLQLPGALNIEVELGDTALVRYDAGTWIIEQYFRRSGFPLYGAVQTGTAGSGTGGGGPTTISRRRRRVFTTTGTTSWSVPSYLDRVQVVVVGGGGASYSDVPPPPDPGGGGGTCFPEGTVVLLEDLTPIPIEYVRVGDRLIGGKGYVNEVMYRDVSVLGGRSLFVINGRHMFTAEHRHLTNDGWASLDPAATKAEDGLEFPVWDASGVPILRPLIKFKDTPVGTLSLGDRLIRADGCEEEIWSIMEVDRLPPEALVYSFVMSGSHTFTANGFIVSGWARDDDFDYGTWTPRETG